MDEFKDQQVVAEREQIRTALNHKLEEVERRLNDKITEVRTAIARTTDIEYQVRQRPWKMFGLSVGGGFIIGRLFSGGRRSRPPRSPKGALEVQSARPSGLMKGVVLGLMAALLREATRQAAPTLIAYLKDYSARAIKQYRSHEEEWQPPVERRAAHHPASHIR